MFDETRLREAYAALHASEETVTEVMNMTTQERTKAKRFGRKAVIAVAAAAALLLAVAATASATGLVDWSRIIIRPDRDADTAARSEIAQAAVEQALGAEMELSDVAAVDDEGRIQYNFYNEDLDSAYANAHAFATVDGDGRITALDVSSYFPYPEPEDYPEDFVLYGSSSPEGPFLPHCDTARWLAEVAYPDRDAYNETVRTWAPQAVDWLHAQGWIEATSEDIDLIWFDYFTPNFAFVDVLMRGGDLYYLHLLPDDGAPVGFSLRPAEELRALEDGHTVNTPYQKLEAVRNGKFDDWQAAWQEELANTPGVG